MIRKHILFHSPRISKFWCESFGIKGTIRRIVVATRTQGIAREADVGLGNNSAILLQQKRTCTCILHTSVSPKENCLAIHLHMIISCLQLHYIVAIPTKELIMVSLANVIVLLFYLLSLANVIVLFFYYLSGKCQIVTSYNWDHQHMWTRSLT